MRMGRAGELMPLHAAGLGHQRPAKPFTEISLGVVALLAGVLLAFTGSAETGRDEGAAALDRVVAIVNNVVIVFSELKNRIQTVRSQLSQSGTQPPPRHVLTKQVLERLILERLQIELANRTGIRVGDDELNRAVAGIARQNGLELREFRDILEQDGYNFAKFREEIRREILLARVQQRSVHSRIKVTGREVDNFLETREKQGSAENEYRLGHILIAVPEGASPEQIAAARERTEEVLGKLRQGADFAQTAVAVSDGQQALQGGDLGWRKAAQVPTLFSEIVVNMEVGGLSEPIRSASGFHIVTLLEKRGDDRMIITQTSARLIVIRPNEITSDADAETRLEQLKERIELGEDFASLARSHSDDTRTAAKGGDLGWLSPGDANPRLEEAIQDLAPGEVSSPFRTEQGWQIVQVVERRDYDGTDQVRRSNAKEQIRRRKTEDELQTWLRQLRDEAYVEYRLEE